MSVQDTGHAWGGGTCAHEPVRARACLWLSPGADPRGKRDSSSRGYLGALGIKTDVQPATAQPRSARILWPWPHCPSRRPVARLQPGTSGKSLHVRAELRLSPADPPPHLARHICLPFA